METVVYAERKGIPLEADLFRSASADPLIVFCHGGGWITGFRDDYHDEARWWREQGISCACVSYRLAPLNPFPAAVADLQDFVRYARAKGHERIVAFGNSAGGHIAAMLALSDDYFGPDDDATGFKADAAIAICPITDMTNPRESQFPVGWPFVEQFVGSLDAEDALLKAASPLFHASCGDGPVLLIHGEEDEIVPVDQSRRLFEALKGFGTPSELHVLPGETHAFSWPAWQRIRELARAWIHQSVAS
ncbi:MAG: alpha/beta hydrolase fold domain-containing protein [Fimbriimonadaceae bacterium]|nr:alpha/beta hydrolase fold domain-containing protein [Fimbriimonadaceae bacterium]